MRFFVRIAGVIIFALAASSAKAMSAKDVVWICNPYVDFNTDCENYVQGFFDGLSLGSLEFGSDTGSTFSDDASEAFQRKLGFCISGDNPVSTSELIDAVREYAVSDDVDLNTSGAILVLDAWRDTYPYPCE